MGLFNKTDGQLKLGGTNMKFSFLAVLLCLITTVMTGCAPKVFTHFSEVDNRKIMQMVIPNSTTHNIFEILPYWDSSLPKNKLIIKIIKNKQYNNDIKIVNGNSLEIFIDSNKYSYKALGDQETTKTDSVDRDLLTGRATGTTNYYDTTLTYLIDFDVLDKMVKGKVIGLKINLINNSSIEDILDDNKETLTNFNAKLKSTFQTGTNWIQEGRRGWSVINLEGYWEDAACYVAIEELRAVTNWKRRCFQHDLRPAQKSGKA